MTAFYHKSIPTVPGIYRITCIPNKRFYIGSAVDLRDRCRRHYQALRRGDHDNIKLQRAWNKYGPDVFTFDVMEYVMFPEMLIPREQYYLDTLLPFGNKGFNIATIAGSTLGVKYSPESRAKLSEIAKNRAPASEATKEKWRLARQGYTHTLETRTKIGTSHIGIRPWLGKTHKPETKEKMRLASLGKKKSPDAIANMVAGKKGQKHRPEAHASKKKILIVTSPCGDTYTVHGIKAFCREHGLDHSALMRVAKGKQPAHKGWKAILPDVSAD